MPLNVYDFGATGDGVIDDTAAIQLALDALMAVPRGGTLYFPAGSYKVTYTLQLVGNPGHNYTIIGDGGGLTSITTLKWAGPAKCTMLDCWGLNWTQFKGLIFDGGGTNLSIAGPSDPPVGTLGAGCATWFHTNQFNSVSHPGIGGGGPTFNVFFDDCSWQSVIGGIYAACAIGDGGKSPGNVTVDKNGTITRYEVETVTPPTIGENAVDTVVKTTLASDAPVGTHTFTLTDITGSCQSSYQ